MARHVPIHIRSRTVNNIRPICTLLARERISDRAGVILYRTTVTPWKSLVKTGARLVSVYVRVLYCSILSSRPGLLTTTRDDDLFVFGCDSHKSSYLSLIQPALGFRFPRSSRRGKNSYRRRTGSALASQHLPFFCVGYYKFITNINFFSLL